MERDHADDGFIVEVAYATPDRQLLLEVRVQRGCTAEEAIELSGIRDEFPGMVVDPSAVGVFSRKVPLDHILRAGDRVEIYRPLIADPREARRQRALKKKGRRKAG
jgi:putative ubiquitin-RnfH superfamily antitoxin RatB of RatAB toxin-antitoxin module